ncbi:amyloid fiber anchoring/assembly protein TapA [Oceanobacillus sp. 1P07AA]|uniref:amyloid fiber anchoring/assembly protein TapA n=1 Tax=Oceanobacillus sp. 1P07AA TaxID=3132293 RepID=UPI0039A74601
MKRIRKFKSKKKSILILKLVAILYVAIACLSMITTTGTASYFSERNQDGYVQAGVWWDGSELIFTEKGTDPSTGCNMQTIQAQIKNIGKDMKQSTTYEIYFSKNGDPKKGEKISTKELAPLKSGKQTTLKFDVTQNGSYQFRVLQHPEFKNDGKQHDEWSKKIVIKCKSNQVKQEKEDTAVNENQQEEKVENGSKENKNVEQNSKNQTDNTETKEEKSQETSDKNDQAETEDIETVPETNTEDDEEVEQSEAEKTGEGEENDQ